MLTALIVAYGAVGAAVFGAGRTLGRRSLAVVAVVPAVTLVWLAMRWSSLLDGEVVTASVRWVPALGLDAAVRLDAFGALMVAAVAGVGLAVLAYTWCYADSGEVGLARLAGLLTMFAGAMVLLVAADDLLTLFTGWELTSITSYLLIGNQHTKIQARAAALHALLVTSAGGLALLAGIALIGQAAGTYRLSAVLADPPTGTAVTVGCLLVACAAFTKSAQYPFHSWLPGAMAAPTPVSAYLHSATMVKAGVYVVARFAPVFAATIGPWRPVALTVGVVTMIAGGLRALRQYDLKLLLAHGTVSQLGFLIVLFAAGTPELTTAGIVVLVSHVLFKAALFMVVGVIDHQVGSRDIRLLPELGAGWGFVKVVSVLAAASMAGVPLLAGFLGKEAALTALVDDPFGGSTVVLVGVVVGSTLTVAYSARFVFGALVLPARLTSGSEGVTVPVATEQRPPAAPPARAFVAPAAVLTALTVAIGLAPVLADDLVAAASTALDRRSHPEHLAIWHGFNAAVTRTLVILGGGGVLFAARRRVARTLRLGERIPSGTDVYLAALRALNRLAARTTAVVQHGTLVIYAGTVLLTVAVLPGFVLLRDTRWPGWPDLIGRPAELPITVVLVVAAVLAAAVRRRFTAVLFLSVVGYGMSALFVVAGAPDLALTQAGVETLSTVLFVLVLRRLPDRFERRSSSLTRSIRLAISLAVASMVFFFAIIARQARVAEPVSTTMIDQSLSEANGRNVVNVILVDFRGLDTLGDISVLAAAAIGAVALARAGRFAGRESAPVPEHAAPPARAEGLQ